VVEGPAQPGAYDDNDVFTFVLREIPPLAA